MKQEYIQEILKSPSIAILRTKNTMMILDFLSNIFEKSTSISEEHIHSLLAEYLNNHSIEIDEENDIQFSDTYEEKAKKYIQHWTHNGFLMNYQNDKAEIYYELSSYSHKVIDWLASLKREDYIGTESKFNSILTQIRELVEYTNEDKEKRLQLLENKKLEIEQQIQQLKMGEDIKVFEEYEIVPRFVQINKLARELLSDFKEVDNNFKTIIKEIYQKQIDPNLNKGDILQYTFDSLYELKSSPQGKSFYAFWDFLLAKDLQSDLKDLIEQLFLALQTRNINHSDNFLRNMLSFLYESGHKVYQTNSKMADKLSRIIRENNITKTNSIKQEIQDIKNLLIEISKTSNKPNISLEIDDKIEINLPFERSIAYEMTENLANYAKPKLNHLSIEEFGDLGKLFNHLAIDKKKLKQYIHHALEKQNQITLAEIIEQHPLQQGLSELVAYLDILKDFPCKVINTNKQQAILLNREKQKYAIIYEMIIAKEIK